MVLAAVVLGFWRSHNKYDPLKVYAQLREISTPYRGVSLSCCMCGDVGFRVWDAAGHSHRFLVPAFCRQEGTFTWGTTSRHDTNGLAVALDVDSRNMLIHMVENYAAPGFERDQALIVLRGDPIDHARPFAKGVVALSVTMGRNLMRSLRDVFAR